MKVFSRLLARLFAAVSVLLLVVVLAFAALGSLATSSADDGPLVARRTHWTAEDRQLVAESLGLDRPLLFASDAPSAERTLGRAWQRLATELERRQGRADPQATAQLMQSVAEGAPIAPSADDAGLVQALRALGALGALGMDLRAPDLEGSQPVLDLCSAWRVTQREALRSAGVAADPALRHEQLSGAAAALADERVTEAELQLLRAAGAASLAPLAMAAAAPAARNPAANWGLVGALAAVHPPHGAEAVAFMERWWRRHGDEFTEAGPWAGLTRGFGGSRCGAWLLAAVAGDFGTSTRHHRPVGEILAERLPATVRTGTLALVFIIALAIPLACLGLRGGRGLCLALDGATALALALPETVLAVSVLMLLEPARGSEVLAALVLASGGAFYFAAHLRVRLAEVLAEPWVFALLMRGVRGLPLFTRHLLRPALGPVVTLTASALPLLVSGSLVVESMFGVQGMGAAAADATFHGDLPLAMASITLGGAATLSSWWLAEVVLLALNPRRNAGGVGA